MIRSFGDKETERIFGQEKSLRLPSDIQKRALVKLMLLDAAEGEADLRSPPSNRFEYLKGKLEDFCSIRVNDQWRIVFKLVDGNAFDVSIVDYH